MKKIVFFVVVAVSIGLFITSAFAVKDKEFTTKLGLEINGNHETEFAGVGVDEDVNTGISLAIELVKNINETLGMGGGLALQLPRELEDYDGDFNFIPIYGLMKIRLNQETTVPYLIGQFGYNIFQADSNYKGDGDLKGGLYYGLGGGVIFSKSVQLELLYSANKGSIDFDAIEFDITYTKIGLSLGYNF